MKKIISFLKFIMYFIAAIWGMVLGILIPASLLISVDYSEYKFNYTPVLWLITSVIGFIVPCFLVKFGLHKIAAALTLAGTVSLFFIYNEFPTNWVAYMPLSVETVAVVVIAILAGRIKKAELDNAPAKSILE